MKISSFLLILLINFSICKRIPIVINTWNFINATAKAYEVLSKQGGTAVS